MSAFDPAGAEQLIKTHPVASAVGGLVIVLIVWYLVASGGSTAQPAATAAPASTDDSAAGIASAQIAANASTAAATIAAGVTNNETAASQTVALATLQGTNDANAAAATATISQAYYGAATDIANANSATAISAITAQAGEQANQDNLISSTFSKLASTLAQFGNQGNASQANSNATLIGLGGLTTAPGNVSTLSVGTGLSSGGAFIGASQVTTSVSQNQNAVNYAVANAPGVQAQTNNLLAYLSSFRQTLAAAFTKTVTASTPVTPPTNANQIAQTNLAPLAGGPGSVVAGNLSAF